MATDAEDVNDLRGRMADSAFWFDPHTIPQYELLVRDGLLTAEEADRYRRERQQMGLPMSISELQPRPAAEFEWLQALGGPSIGRAGARVDLAGEIWEAKAYGPTRSISCYDHQPHGIPGGYLERKISKAFNRDGATWEATFKLPGAERCFARRHGDATTFGEALTAVRAVRFEPVTFAGLVWYEDGWGDGKGWVTAVDGQELKLYMDQPNNPDGSRWVFNLDLAEGSILRGMADLFGAYQLAGRAGTRDDAVSAALAAPHQLRTLAGQLLGDERFEAGRRAGREELKALISRL